MGKARGGLDEASRAASRGVERREFDAKRDVCVLNTATRDGCAKKGSL